MSIERAIQRIIVVLQSSDYAALVAAVNADAGLWAGVDITVFAEIDDHFRDTVQNHPVAMLMPDREESTVYEHSGQKIVQDNVGILVESRSQKNAQDAHKMVRAIATCVEAVIETKLRDNTFHDARVESIEYNDLQQGTAYIGQALVRATMKRQHTIGIVT